ncbi:hypothetical protein LTR17_006341 [Elasticomyces elasticus]|nr:hypothetical protein LTR17_006341 [Elasticomyces elasticus]
MANLPPGQALAGSVASSSASGVRMPGPLKRKAMADSPLQSIATPGLPRAEARGIPNPETIRSSIDGGSEPSPKKAKATEASTHVSDSAVTLAQPSSKPNPRLSDLGIHITITAEFFLTVPHLAGYLNLDNTAQVGELWYMCREPLWQSYQQQKSKYNGTIVQRGALDMRQFLRVLNECSLAEIEDIKSTSEPDFAAYSKADRTIAWPYLVRARFIYQVFKVVAASKEFAHVFSGSGPGQIGHVIRPGTLSWNAEDVFRAIMMDRVYQRMVLLLRDPKDFDFSTESIGQRVVRPVFINSSGRDRGAPPSSARKQITQAAGDVAQSKPRITANHPQTITPTDHQASQPQARSPEAVARSFRELTVDDVVATPGNDHNVVNTIEADEQPSVNRVKQTSPNVSNSLAPASMNDVRGSLSGLSTQHKSMHLPSEESKLAAENAQIQRQLADAEKALATMQKSIEDTTAMDVGETKLLEQERIEAWKRQNADLKAQLAQRLKEAEKAKAALVVTDGSFKSKKLERERLERERLASK